MGKKPTDFQKFIDELDNQMIESIDDLKAVSDDQWKDMKIPIALVNRIKKKLSDNLPS